MKKSITDLLGKQFLFFDGGTGTCLQKRCLPPGYFPEKWNIEKPEEIISLHLQYLQSGADIIKTNTFGANGFKFSDGETTENSDCSEYSLVEIVTAAIKNANESIYRFEKDFREKNPQKEIPQKFVALDIGPIAKLLEPMGDLPFETAIKVYSKIIKAANLSKPDLILFETFTDSYSLKAAILAAKENSDIPVFSTVAIDEKGRLLTGADISTISTLLEGLDVDALGFNCGLGPIEMSSYVFELLKQTNKPVIINPNAGMPRVDSNGQTFYDIDSKFFAKKMVEFANEGVCVLGGCCGTTPEFISTLKSEISKIEIKTDVFSLNKNNQKNTFTRICSGLKSVELQSGNPVLIGERINPTGKPRFKQALRDSNIQYILAEGIKQEEAGVQILDVNVGLPEIDEPSLLERVVKELQSVVTVPLQIDTSDPVAMEKALRVYNGIALINSVNGKDEVMDSVFPLVKKYGGVVVGLALDKGGIPETAEGRLKIAKHIFKKAEEYGISKSNIMIDPLCLAVSSGSTAANITLDSLNLLQQELSCPCVMGVSNVSFGLPRRELINSTFFTMAMQRGLAAGIINPFSAEIMNAYYAFRCLSAVDEHCEKYISVYANTVSSTSSVIKTSETTKSGNENPSTLASTEQTESKSKLYLAVIKGMQTQAVEEAKSMLEKFKPLDIIQNELIPALDYVGKLFEKGKFFLPQLLMSADTSQAAFSVLQAEMEKKGEKTESKGTVIVATVEGDIHDIGKNIVKTLLENFGFDVIDLGKDVPPKVIVDTAKQRGVKLIGLSALMTTTVPSMQATIELLKKEKVESTVIVGGAVLTEEYAKMIGADKYCKDAMETVGFAQNFFICK